MRKPYPMERASEPNQIGGPSQLLLRAALHNPMALPSEIRPNEFASGK